jgi:hypothetical protein
MEKRYVLVLWLVVAMLPLGLSAQNDPGKIRTKSQMGKIYPLKQSANWKPLPPTSTVFDKGPSADDPSPLSPNETVKGEPSAKTNSTNAFVVTVGQNFEGNHMTGGTPSDNNLAISNNGLIVSVDNYSIAYFKENGDTMTQFGLPLTKLYSDTTMDRAPFDPRVIYDSYEDRFILASLFHSNDFKHSRLLLSFSKPLVADTVEWNHYEIDCDSTFTLDNEAWYYFDYPNISVTRSQLIVTCRIAKHDTVTGSNPLRTNVIFQIDKAAGYNALPALDRKDWKDVENTETIANLNLVPAMDALQGLSSDTVVYFVTSYNSGTKFFWFELKGAINSPTAQIIPHATFTNFFYSAPSYASQLGGFGGDRISVLDCDIQYALLQNNKLHFVFTRSDNGWAELVYANIEIGTNGFFATTFSGSNASENYLRPSISCYGVDSTDENYLIGFLRTGPNQYPDVCAVNYDSTGFSPVLTTVKAGNGLIDWRLDLVAPWDSLERWGDYTSIQRRYRDPFRRCWMVGAYPYGIGGNHYGELSSVNAWIAELGDSLPALGSVSPLAIQNFRIHPNPASNWQSVTLDLPSAVKGNVQIFDALGAIKQMSDFVGNKVELSVNGLPSGMYFVRIDVKGKIYESQKLVVRN